MLKAQTQGTWIVIAANCVLALVGVMQGVDWMHVAGSSSAGWITAILAAANAAAHYLTGPDSTSR